MRRILRSVRSAFRSALAKRRGRAVQVAILLSYSVFRIMPARVAFATIVLSDSLRLPARAALARGFAPIVAQRELKTPGIDLSSRFTGAFAQSSVRALHGVGAYRECCEFVAARGVGFLSPEANELWARSLFELGRFREAREAIEASASRQNLATRPHLAQLKAHLDLIAGDEAQAVTNLEIAVRGIPHLLCPHQNLSARYSTAYNPTALDLLSGPEGRLFDAYNFVGQRVAHVGEGQLSASLFAAALAAQRRLRSAPPPQLSSELRALLKRQGLKFEDLKILPVEWYTQIGHQGMLDILFRMRELGWWRGKAIFLMPPRAMVANEYFQRAYEKFGYVLAPGHNVSDQVARELFSLQRWSGMAFNAFELPSGEVVPWQEAGALAIRQWEFERRGDPMREEFDRTYGDNDAVILEFAKARKQWGMKPDDWYVCLHLRDASHYGELAGAGQTHRNATVRGYLKTIDYITSQGGWVLKLGGPKSPRLPKMERVLDYARHPTKSPILDLHLIRNSRYFIGATSGLTNVAVSLGTPCALVNCITTDAQLWTSRVRFALKGIRLRDGRLLGQHQLTSTPWRWRAFTAEVLARHGAAVVENTSEEILETAKEVEFLAAGRAQSYATGIDRSEDLLARWRGDLALPYFYGNAQPSLVYVKNHYSLSGELMPSRLHGVTSGAASALPEKLSGARSAQARRQNTSTQAE